MENRGKKYFILFGLFYACACLIRMQYLMFSFAFLAMVIIKEKWKFILNEYDNSKELYNLENDPNELENIAGNGLEMEEILLKELNKLQNIIL